MSRRNPERIFPKNHREPYIVEASRGEGELELARIAATSRVEYAWEYDGIRSLWRYEPSTHIARTRRALAIGRIWDIEVGLSVPDSLCTPSGDSSSFYHIHPTHTLQRLGHRKTAASFPIQSQMPSGPDIKSSLMLMRDGFKDSRIVTPLGITALSLDTERAWESGKFSVSLPKVRFSVEELAIKAERTGFEATLEYVFAHMNSAYHGLLAISYQAHPLEV